MTYPDPAAYGSVHTAPRPPRFDRCPECGAALEWAAESVQMPDGTERWTGHGAECSCGMRYDWAPNAPHLRQARRHRAAMAWENEQATEQLRVI